MTQHCPLPRITLPLTSVPTATTYFDRTIPFPLYPWRFYVNSMCSLGVKTRTNFQDNTSFVNSCLWTLWLSLSSEPVSPTYYFQQSKQVSRIIISLFRTIKIPLSIEVRPVLYVSNALFVFCFERFTNFTRCLETFLILFLAISYIFKYLGDCL